MESPPARGRNKNLAEAKLGDGPDATGYDAKNKLVFASNGDGTLSVVDAGKVGYQTMQTLPTMKGARTMASTRRRERCTR